MYPGRTDQPGLTMGYEGDGSTHSKSLVAWETVEKHSSYSDDRDGRRSWAFPGGEKESNVGISFWNVQHDA